MTAPKPSPTVSFLTTFRADDAGVIIRVEGAPDFRVHKGILSFVSPVFKDMFAIPQPPTDTPGVLPHVDVQDPPGAWEMILCTIYPMPNPVINNLDDLESLLLTARKYEMEFVIDSHKHHFEDQAFIREEPLRLYAIACASGFEEQAKYVARHAEFQTVMRSSGAVDMKGLTLKSYHRLIFFLFERDNKWSQIIAGATDPSYPHCHCFRDSGLSKPIKENLPIPYLQTGEIHLKALEYNSRGCNTHKDRCSASKPQIKNFIKLLVNARDGACDKLMW